MDDPSHVCVLALELSQGSISISRNLDIALRHIRHGKDPRWMWIDALCINQADSDEKSIQVTLMGLVFSQADYVIAWLGPEEQNSQYALELMQHMAEHVEVDWEFHQLRPSKNSKDTTWASVHIPIPFTVGELDSICTVLNRPYFRRTWVRQEIILATRAYFQCGYQKLLWLDFRKAIGCLAWKNYYPSSFQVAWNMTVQINSAVSLCEMSLDMFYYSSIRIVLRGTECEDPRDRIYAIQALLNTEDQELDIRPNYSRTVEELYIDVARRNIVERCRLNVIETCEVASRNLTYQPGFRIGRPA
jgi:hypothetical protein